MICMEKTIKMPIVLIDTNFLVDIFRFGIGMERISETVGSKPKLVIVGQSIKELEKLNLMYAKLSLKYIDSERISILDMPGSNADDAILSFLSEKVKKSEKRDVILATNDSRLRKKAKGMGVRVIYLRARKHLEISD